MYVPLDKMISVAGTGYRVFKWWRQRRDRAEQLRRRRCLIRDLTLTAIALGTAIGGMALLGNLG